MRHLSSSIAILTLFLATACTSPDPQERYNEFSGSTADARILDGATGEGVTIDFSGTYLMGLSSILEPSLPMLIQVDVSLVESGEALDEGVFSMVDFVFMPLKTDLLLNGDPREDAREPMGEIIEATGTYYEDGTFDVVVGDVEVGGEANPVSGLDILAYLTLSGRVDSEDFFCGNVGGDLVLPIAIPLEGSTFASQRGEPGFPDISEIIYNCPATEEPVEPSPEPVPDMGQDMPTQDHSADFSVSDMGLLDGGESDGFQHTGDLTVDGSGTADVATGEVGVSDAGPEDLGTADSSDSSDGGEGDDSSDD